MSDSSFSKIKASTVKWIEIVLIIAGFIYGFAIVKSQVDSNTDTNERQDIELKIHKEKANDTFVRKDVAAQRYQNLIDKLDALKESQDN